MQHSFWRAAHSHYGQVLNMCIVVYTYRVCMLCTRYCPQKTKEPEIPPATNYAVLAQIQIVEPCSHPTFFEKVVEKLAALWYTLPSPVALVFAEMQVNEVSNN